MGPIVGAGIGGACGVEAGGMETLLSTFAGFLDGALPGWLSERAHVVSEGAGGDGLRPAGEFALYWMHHAVRGHENPAFDAARAIAAELGVPLVVYQGLGGRHDFNNDRHHAFILEGAAAAAAEIRATGARYVFHLPERVEGVGPLVPLASRAAVVVTEDFPAPPFPSWTERLAERCGRPVVAVDAACIVPMRSVAGRHDRAFRFRDKTKKAFRARAARAYPGVEASVPAGDSVDVGFESFDVENADVCAAIARCDIDHSVAPVGHTRGGSAAGYERWEAFKAKGLRGYAKRRNTAEIHRDELAVSRMSAYLHHGHVSPFRLIRETSELLDGPCREGAEKYIDELWLWRELAHHFALVNEGDLHSTRVLPDWARRTIADHAGDERELLDRETLSRGRTGDALWDAAQRSLLAHGELHNNVRMTWGKAMLGWHADAGGTQSALIDLNHRYALDGSDPNSYGGLLWCLGALDRPFNQDEPVYGTVRTRPTSVHAGRMDLGRYEAMVAEPGWGRAVRVAVVGGGVAGFAAARVLADHNAWVTVYEREGSAGGVGDGSVDEAVFAVSDERFGRAVSAWVEAGVVEKRGDGYVGAAAVERHLAETIGGVETAVRFGREVARVRAGDGGGWMVELAGRGEAERFDAVVVALGGGAAGVVGEGLGAGDGMGGLAVVSGVGAGVEGAYLGGVAAAGRVLSGFALRG